MWPIILTDGQFECYTIIQVSPGSTTLTAMAFVTATFDYSLEKEPILAKASMGFLFWLCLPLGFVPPEQTSLQTSLHRFLQSACKGLRPRETVM